MSKEHPKPAATSRWRLMVERAGGRRPPAVRQGQVVAAYHLGYMHGIKAAGDAWTRAGQDAHPLTAGTRQSR
jgi:hypothetical protein